MKSRVNEAVNNFKSGYNCAQSVFITYADLFGLDKDTALKLSCSFGGGMGRMREVCGAVSGMLMLAGLQTGNTDPLNQDAKAKNYDTVQHLAKLFKKENDSIICKELLGLKTLSESTAPELRTKEYYKKRPCAQMVETAAKLVEEELLSEIFF